MTNEQKIEIKTIQNDSMLTSHRGIISGDKTTMIKILAQKNHQLDNKFIQKELILEIIAELQKML